MRKTVCRICLHSDFQRTDDIDVKLLHFYDELCDFDVLQKDNLKFCTLCEDILRKFYNFRLRCKEAHKILKTHEKKGIENLQNIFPPTCIGLASQSENIIDLPCDEDQPEIELQNEELIEMEIKTEDIDDPIAVTEDINLYLEPDLAKQEDISKPDDFAMSCAQTDSTNTKTSYSINNEIMIENDETIIKEEEIIDDQFDDIDNFDSDDEEIPKIIKKQDLKKGFKQKKIISPKAMKRKLDEKEKVDDISNVGDLEYKNNTTQKQMNKETTRHVTHKSGEPVSTELTDVLSFGNCITNNGIIDCEIIGPDKPIGPEVNTYYFHAYTSAPSVQPYEVIKAPMLAPLSVNQDASPVSLRKFYDRGNTIINTSPPISPISGVGVLPMSEEEPDSEEETRTKLNWNSTKNYNTQKSKKSKGKKKEKVDKEMSSNSTSESENESSVIITTNALIENPRRYNSNVRKDSLGDTKNQIPDYRSVTIVETTDCESVTGNTQLQNVEANIQRKKNFRWKKRDETQWKRAVEKEKKRSCLPYEDTKGKLHAAKLPKPRQCNMICRHKCSEAFTETERLEICKDYWSIKNFTSQKEYLLKRITIKPVTRSLNILPVEKQRSSSREYSLFKNGELIRVCKSFFTTTLAISNGPIETAVKNINLVGSFGGNDKRGKRIPPNKTSEESIKYIKDHIESFPRIESHYCRKDTTREYLSEKLSISKMYELYSQKMQNENRIPVKFNIYQKIFGTEYNLIFYHPKKDQCCLCNRYKRTPDPDDALKKEYEDHIKRKETSFVSKENDSKNQKKTQDPIV